MPSLPKKLIDTAAELGRKAVEVGGDIAGRLRREETDTTVPPPERSPAPKAGAPGAPKSATITRTPKAKAAAVKPTGRGCDRQGRPEEGGEEPRGSEAREAEAGPEVQGRCVQARAEGRDEEPGGPEAREGQAGPEAEGGCVQARCAEACRREARRGQA